MKKTIIFIMLLIASVAFASDVKEADLAGTWYPGSREELLSLLRKSLDYAEPEKVEGPIFAIISPHAGFKYSAQVAAYGYKLAASRDIKTVIILGFTHQKTFDGISIYDKGAFSTPLGAIPVNTEVAASFRSASRRFIFNPDAFEDENSVELQIPFIQAAFKDASIVPISFGTQDFSDAEIAADALADVLKDKKDCLVVASTDLSHYHPYKDANVIDMHFMAMLSEMKGKELYDDIAFGLSEACGIMPLTTTLLAAEKLGFDKIKILKYANSGDTYGDRAKVVGYVSAVLYKDRVAAYDVPDKKEDAQMLLNSSQRKRLLDIARESITSFVRDGKRANFTEKDPLLNKPMGAFVTLHENGQLRGCIGNMVAQGPLFQTVADMAVEAATEDPRFSAIRKDEIGKIDLEVSVLTPLRKISSPDEIKIPGHGVLVRRGYRSGVYLPQVATEAGWNKEEFMTSLCESKAGLAPDAWKDPATELYVFSAEVFGEKDGSE
ncbi:MAG: AmmeMemoRadiSam system protein B [Candidatus Omnitrophica bacterium]|nr:AmmeMemoRadiSam system protein B [Candidatus Omnitrophota bacterium]